MTVAVPVYFYKNILSLVKVTGKCNSCYLNSVLISMLYSPFSDRYIYYLIEDDDSNISDSNICHKDPVQNSKILKQLKSELIKLSMKMIHSEIVATDSFSNILDYCDATINYKQNQQDANEFVEFLMNIIKNVKSIRSGRMYRVLYKIFPENGIYLSAAEENMINNSSLIKCSLLKDIKTAYIGNKTLGYSDRKNLFNLCNDKQKDIISSQNLVHYLEYNDEKTKIEEFFILPEETIIFQLSRYSYQNKNYIFTDKKIEPSEFITININEQLKDIANKYKNLKQVKYKLNSIIIYNGSNHYWVIFEYYGSWYIHNNTNNDQKIVFVSDSYSEMVKKYPEVKNRADTLFYSVTQPLN